MNRFDNAYRAYDPEILQTMGIAFDAAWDVLQKRSNNEKGKGRELAHFIFRLVDEGETDALRVCKLVLDEIGQTHSRDVKEQTPSDLVAWNSLRSLPGGNRQVPRAHDLHLSADNRSQIIAGGSE